MSVVLLRRDWSLRLGGTVYLVQPSSFSALQTKGEVLRLERDQFVLGLEHEPGEATGRCVFAVTEERTRLASTGFVRRLSAVEVVCRPLSPWQEISVNRRSSARYPTALKAIVKSGESGDGSPLFGTVVDISEGGCALATRSAPPDSRLELSVRLNSYSVRLACVQVGVSAADDRHEGWFLSHLQFESVGPNQRAFLRMLLDQHESTWSDSSA